MNALRQHLHALATRWPLALASGGGGIALLLVLLSTGTDYEGYVKAHGHAHVAPHGGTLVVLGDHVAHIELLLEPETGRLTAYALDGHAEAPVRLSATELDLSIRFSSDESWQAAPLAARANALSGETVGDTSEFTAELPFLKGKKRFEVRLPPITIRGVAMPAIETHFPEGNELSR